MVIERFVANLLVDEQSARPAAQQVLPVRSRQIIASQSTMEELMRARAEAVAQQRSVKLGGQHTPQHEAAEPPPQHEPPQRADHQRGQQDWDVLPFA